MKLYTILLTLILLLLFSSSASAWEQSFEGHANDLDESLFVPGTVNGLGTPTAEFSSESHGVALKFTGLLGNYDAGFLNISAPYNGYLGFSFYGKSNNVNFLSTDCGLKLYSESGSLVEDTGIIFPLVLYGNDSTQFHRADFITSGNSLNFYVDGVLRGSHAIPSLSGVTAIRLEIKGNSQSYTTDYLYLDDFSTDSTIISCDSLASSTEAGQYYRVGFPITTGSYWYSRIYDPSGTQILHTTESGFGTLPYSEHLIPIQNLSTSGTYRISLYRHDNATGKDYHYVSKSFSVSDSGEEDDGLGYYFAISDSTVSPGDTIYITSYLPAYETGYTIKSAYYLTSTTRTVDSLAISSQDQSTAWTVPSAALGGINYIYLVDPSGDVVSSLQYTIETATGTPTLRFSKSAYSGTDSVYLTYTNLSSDASAPYTLNVYEHLNGHYTAATSYYILGDGVKTYSIQNTSSKSLYAVILQNNETIATASANIISGTYILKGQIFDATTQAPISGATVTLDATSLNSSTNGEYEFSAAAGTHTITVSKTGYATATNSLNLDIPIKSLNFYLTPSYTATSGAGSLYGITTNSLTGEALSSAYIQIKNGSTTYSTLSRSGTGNYVFDSEDLIGTWTLTATKTGYDTYSAQISIDGDTYHQIQMHPIGSSSDGSDDSGTDDTDSTGVPADRPGREAAKGVMEEFEAIVPGLIGLVIFRVIMELMS